MNLIIMHIHIVLLCKHWWTIIIRLVIHLRVVLLVPFLRVIELLLVPNVFYLMESQRIIAFVLVTHVRVLTRPPLVKLVLVRLMIVLVVVVEWLILIQTDLIEMLVLNANVLL